jgi:DNA-binding transcriptional LysR family regulator
MELMQLRYFRLLAQKQHLTKTAQELHITPPALSVSISKLEEELGAALFDKAGRNIRLNEYGKVMLLYTEQIFQSIQTAQQAIKDMQNHQSNSVSVFIRDPAFYHHDFQTFYENNPDINFRLLGGELALNADVFYEHGLDFVITPRSLRGRADLECAILYRDRFLLAVPKNHSLADRDEVSFAELRNEKFIGHSHSYFQDRVDLLCEKNAFTPHYVMRCDYIMRTEMLAKGAGIVITTLHSSTTGYFDNAKFLRIKELNDEPFDFYIYWIRSKQPSLTAQMFKRYLEERYAHLR